MVVPISQDPRTTTRNASRSPLTSSRRFERARVRARSLLVGSGQTKALRDDALSALIAHQHLIPKVVPDLLIDPRELRLETDLGDVARARQIDAVDALHRPRPRRDHDDTIGERDRLLKVMGDEDNRSACGGPQLQKLVFHQRPRLDVERAERLVHEENAWLVDERLRERGPLAHAAGELVRVVPLESRQADTLDPVASAFVGVRTVDATEPRAGGYVVEHALPWEDCVDLKNVSNVAANAPHDLVTDAYLALTRWLEP